MLLYFYFILAFSYIKTLEGHFQNQISETNKRHLREFIKTLNSHKDGDKVSDRLDVDTEKELNDEEKEEKLQEILWLIKNNYNAGLQHDRMLANPKNSGSRIHFIKNPEVLDEYRNYLRTKVYPSSTDDSSETSDYRKNNLKEILKKTRKDAALQLELTENSDSDNTESNEKYTKKGIGMKISKDEKLDEVEENIPLDSLDIHNNIHEGIEKEIDKDARKDDRLDSDKDTDSKDTDNDGVAYRSKKSDDEYVRTTREILDTTLGYKKVKRYEVKHKSKKRKSDKLRSNVGSFGRTSVPYVGNKGVYEDK